MSTGERSLSPAAKLTPRATWGRASGFCKATFLPHGEVDPNSEHSGSTNGP